MQATCPGCDAEISVDTTECPECGFSLIVRNSVPRPTIRRMAVRPRRTADVEVAVTIDSTASSLQFANGIPILIENLLTDVRRITRACHVWLQTHGDESEGMFPLLRCDRCTVDEAVGVAQRIGFAGGGLPDEDHLKAIDHLAGIVPFTASSTCRAVLVAVINAESKPLDNGSPFELGRELADRGLLIYVIGEPTPRIVEFVAGAGGQLLPITNSPQPDELSEIVTRIGASIRGTIVSGATRPIAIDFDFQVTDSASYSVERMM